jgi:hypothetical protein
MELSSNHSTVTATTNTMPMAKASKNAALVIDQALTWVT